MKHLFIVNPIAGGRDATAEVEEAVRAAFASREDQVEIYVTKGPMDAPEKIRAEAASGEPLRVYACGGDGTFNECVCGAAELENVAAAPFPTGTGNDFCRMFGPEKNLFRDLNALLDGTEHPIDLINCNGRWSANICSVGIDARVGCSVHKYTHLPLCKGAGAYVVSLVDNVFKGVATRMHIKSAGYESTGKFTLCCACNGRYYGGGFNPSAAAMPDDGLLDIYIVKGVGILKVASLVGRYAAGKADELPEYITHLRGTEVEIELDKPDSINVDGEELIADKLSFRLVPRALRLIVPRGMRFFDGPRA